MSVWIHLGYVLLLLFLVAYVLWSARKEIPLMLLFHVLIQYGFTLGIWFFTLSPTTTGVLLVGLCIGTPILIWGRILPLGKQWTASYRISWVMGWILISGIVGWMVWKGPYAYQEVSQAWRDIFPGTPLLLNQAFKWVGNGLLFLTFFQIILHWGERWTALGTWLSFGPIVLYLFVLILLQVHLSTLDQAPFS